MTKETKVNIIVFTFFAAPVVMVLTGLILTGYMLINQL